MNEMNATVQEVARNASAAANMAAETRNEALKGAGIVSKALESIEQVHQGSVALKEDMARLDEHTRNITQIVSVITDIADSDQSAGAQCRHRGRPRGRGRARFCRGGRRGAQAGRKDHEFNIGGQPGHS